MMNKFKSKCSDIISDILKIGIHNYSFEHKTWIKNEKNQHHV